MVSSISNNSKNLTSVICLHTVKWFQVFLYKSKNLYRNTLKPFNCVQISNKSKMLNS